MPRVRDPVQHARRRHEILEAAAVAFRQFGYHGASIEHIASQLGISKGAIYYYFDSKEDLLLHVCERAVDLALQQVCDLSCRSGDASVQLRSLLQGHLQTLHDHADVWAVFFQEPWARTHPHAQSIRSKQRRFSDEIEKLIAGWQAEGMACTIDVALVSLALLGMCNWAHRWIGSSPYNVEQIADAFFSIVGQGLLTVRSNNQEASRPGDMADGP